MSLSSKFGTGLKIILSYQVITTLCTIAFICIVTGKGCHSINENGVKRTVQIIWYGPAYNNAYPLTYPTPPAEETPLIFKYLKRSGHGTTHQYYDKPTRF